MKIYDDFPIFFQKNNDVSLIYLDSASTSQKPQRVIDAISTAYATINANPGRGIYQLAEKAAAAYEDARRKVATFINAEPDEIIFVRGATEGLNFIAQGFGSYHLKDGDEILLSELEHHANLVPWQRVAKQTGAQLKFIPVNQAGELAYDQVEKLLTAKTKIVAITHSSNALGTHVDLGRIVPLAKAAGAKVLVDACQTAPHQKIDVKKIDCDFLAFSGHKMLGPNGIGVLYAKKSAQSFLEPLLLGGGSVSEVTWDSYTLRQAPEKYEAGTPSYIQAVGLAAAIDFLEKRVPFDQLAKHESSLCSQLIDGLSSLTNITILGPQEQLKKNGHLISFVHKSIHAHDVSALLDQQGICVRAGNFCAQPLMRKIGHESAIRASFYCYNRPEDVAKLLEALESLK